MNLLFYVVSILSSIVVTIFWYRSCTFSSPSISDPASASSYASSIINYWFSSWRMCGVSCVSFSAITGVLHSTESSLEEISLLVWLENPGPTQFMLIASFYYEPLPSVDVR